MASPGGAALHATQFGQLGSLPLHFWFLGEWFSGSPTSKDADPVLPGVGCRNLLLSCQEIWGSYLKSCAQKKSPCLRSCLSTTTSGCKDRFPWIYRDYKSIYRTEHCNGSCLVSQLSVEHLQPNDDLLLQLLLEHQRPFGQNLCPSQLPKCADG